MMERMTLEDYKKKVEELLVSRSGVERTKALMKVYEQDFPMFLEENWEPELTVTAMIMGY